MGRKWLWRCGRGFLAIALLAGLYLGGLQLSGNFHTVIAGELYRSAQPSTRQLTGYVKAHGIRTVVNLRGADETASWYKDEMEASRALGLNHVDFRMSPGKRLTTEQSQELIALLKDSPRPILIHCKAGADRTGLVSTIYLQQIAGIAEDTAEWQLSPLYGHVVIPYLSAAFAMDESWESLEMLLGISS